MDATADLTMNGEETGSRFGCSVASAGDVNGDGYSDAIVGSEWYNNKQGRAYLCHGGGSMDTTADLTMSGEGTDNYFGSSVASAGGLNGYSDGGMKGLQADYKALSTLECVLEDKRAWASALVV